jgi:hypothetical protein
MNLAQWKDRQTGEAHRSLVARLPSNTKLKTIDFDLEEHKS